MHTRRAPTVSAPPLNCGVMRPSVSTAAFVYVPLILAIVGGASYFWLRDQQLNEQSEQARAELEACPSLWPPVSWSNPDPENRIAQRYRDTITVQFIVNAQGEIEHPTILRPESVLPSDFDL